MKTYIFILGLLLISTTCFSQEKEVADEIQKEYLENNKETIEYTKPMLDFLFKYQDSSKTATQSDFDGLLKMQGGVSGTGNSNGGLTKEQGFQIVDAYIKASESETKSNKEEDIDEGESEIEREQEKALEQVEELLNSDAVIIEYADFREYMKIMDPSISEAKIKESYNKMTRNMKQFNKNK